jgi:hypothetical protein
MEGIQSDKVRARLLRESELDLQKCIDICRADEAAIARMKSLSNTCDLNNVDQVNSSRGNMRGNPSSSMGKSKFETKKRDPPSTCSRCGYTHG